MTTGVDAVSRGLPMTCAYLPTLSTITSATAAQLPSNCMLIVRAVTCGPMPLGFQRCLHPLSLVPLQLVDITQAVGREAWHLSSSGWHGVSVTCLAAHGMGHGRLL